MSVRTRIAPSPTGYMHIGTLRTALYDYFLARQKGGEFIIRIEDTDQTRFVPGALESLLGTFQKLGIEHDEGPVLASDGSISEKGDVGPYVQSKRLDIYKKYADELLANGHAYVCFCTKERLDEMRAAQTAAKQTPKYDRHCVSLSADEVKTRIDAREAHVVRMKLPEGSTTFHDAIRGEITFKHADLDDQVIVKGDGFPTYHLAVVVDDHLMNITHVIRGEEWLSSTPKHLLLFKMLNWEAPTFAHVPLLLNADRSKLSKRQGDVAVEDYLNKGYLPDALLSFVATLGFNPKADQEIYTMKEMIELFDLSKVNKGGAVMNIEKLDWMNHHYIASMNESDLLQAIKPFAEGIDLKNPVISKAITVEKPRVNRLTEFAEKIRPYIERIDYDPSILVWKKADKADALQNLQKINEFIGSVDSSVFEDISLIEEKIKEYITSQGLSNGNVLWPMRVALSGQAASASPFELLWVLGKEEGRGRLEAAIEKLS
jgi:glutamyl-tRNA synthetase